MFFIGIDESDGLDEMTMDLDHVYCFDSKCVRQWGTGGVLLRLKMRTAVEYGRGIASTQSAYGSRDRDGYGRGTASTHSTWVRQWAQARGTRSHGTLDTGTVV